MRAPFAVRELHCKSAINRVRGMPFDWSINPYRGCRHACIYCYARPTHEYLGLNGGEEFQEVIFAKVNAPEVVRRELAKRSWRGDHVVIGTATAPYQQAESRYRITRGILEAFRDFRNPVSITTKSPMVLRDLDVLEELNRYADVAVHFTVTTMDQGLWRKTEPTTAKPKKRLEALRAAPARYPHRRLPQPGPPRSHRRQGAARGGGGRRRRARADALFSQALRLGPGISEYYLPFVEREFPELAARYAQLYRYNTPSGAYSEEVQSRVAALKRRYGLSHGTIAAKTPASRPAPAVQLGLFSSPD